MKNAKSQFKPWSDSTAGVTQLGKRLDAIASQFPPPVPSVESPQWSTPPVPGSVQLNPHIPARPQESKTPPLHLRGRGGGDRGNHRFPLLCGRTCQVAGGAGSLHPLPEGCPPRRLFFPPPVRPSSAPVRACIEGLTRTWRPPCTVWCHVSRPPGHHPSVVGRVCPQLRRWFIALYGHSWLPISPVPESGG